MAVFGLGAVVGLLAGYAAEGLSGGTAGAFLYLCSQLTSSGLSASTRLSRLGQAALVGAGGCLSLLGLVRFLSPAMGVVLVSVLAMASPPAMAVWARYIGSAAQRLAPRTRVRPRRLVPLAALAGLEAAPLLARSLTDVQLCWAWRTSFVALHRTSDLQQQAGVVLFRQAYLDELERRNPAGFAHWLYTGARPASDPSRYLLPN